MFATHRLVSVPATLQPKLEIGYKCMFGSLGVMFAGMIFASIWQWMFGIKSVTLMDSPVLLRVLMIGGFIAFLIALVSTIIVLPIWHQIHRH
jgi:hypothetical protein